MKYISLITLLLLSLTSIAQQSLELQLFDLCGVSFEKIKTAESFQASYKLLVKQPIDHKDPSAGSFYQKVYLNHRGYELPTVQVSEGYNRNGNRIYELTDFIAGNQATVEHRYFGESMPDTLDYNYLNFEQATADLHHINELLRQIYSGKFISTGISKGGTTTIFYRYFYPDDVAVSVPYVAPLNTELEEKRIYDFLNTKGSKECRSNILSFQKRVLKDRDYHLERLKWFTKGKDLSFSYLNMDEAFEYAVLEYPFSFWQWGASCDKVPQNEATNEEDLNHLLEVSGLDFYGDAAMDGYASHYYQSGTQMGYYGYEVNSFKGLLKALPDNKNPTAVFPPNKIETQWDGTLTNKVVDWISKEGNNFIYINGLDDTWSATRVPNSRKVNSVWFDMEGQSHGTARIANMTEEEKVLLKNTLNRWLN